MHCIKRGYEIFPNRAQASMMATRGALVAMLARLQEDIIQSNRNIEPAKEMGKKDERTIRVDLPREAVIFLCLLRLTRHKMRCRIF